MASHNDSEQSPVLATKVASLELTNPVMVASGTYGTGREASALVDLSSIGGIIVKSMTLHPWKGKPTPRMCETPSGMLNAIGIQNKGIDHFVDEDLPWLLKRDATVIASIAGNTVDEFVKLAKRLRINGRGIAGVEVNISCPNLEDRNDMFAHSVDASHEVISGVKHQIKTVPVFAKLSPNVTSLEEIADAAIEAGADGLSLINTVFGMAIDVETRRPRLAAGTGGLSGPAIKPVAIRAVHQIHRALPEVPIIGMGGVTTVEDIIEFILAGASAVAVGTATFMNPMAASDLLDALPRWCADRGLTSLAALRGTVQA